MSPEVVSALIQAPTVIALIVFVLYWQKGQQIGIRENHQEWQKWLGQQNEQWREWMAETSRTYLEEMRTRYNNASQERAQLTQAIQHLDSHVERLTTINLIVYARLSGDDEEVRRLEKELIK